MAPKSVHFPKIFEPAFLGPLEVRNRLIMAPMGSRLAIENEWRGVQLRFSSGGLRRKFS